MDTAAVFAAKKKLNDFLREHPELVKAQRNLEMALDLAPDQNGRIFLMRQFLSHQVKRLQDTRVELSAATQKLKALLTRLPAK